MIKTTFENNSETAQNNILLLKTNMLIQDMEYIIPKDWSPMDVVNEKYKLISLHPNTDEHQSVLNSVSVGLYFNLIQGVYRVQNPFLFTKFRLKTFDFEQKGSYDIKTLFHDTSRDNVASIAMCNFDWRFGSRFRYGPGVYFSTNPFLANKHSSKNNGAFRSMFIAQVLTQNIQIVDGDIFLPDYGFDTALCHNDETYVKYFDGEYYPQYVVDYIWSNPQ